MRFAILWQVIYNNDMDKEGRHAFVHIIRHFRTITHHRHLVMKNCFKVGLYWRGLTHDLSKYSPTEFWRGAKYYRGTFSPTQQERRENGYSLAWMHHKGRNRHHFEYWTDVSPVTHRYEPLEMPTEFFVEMCMDRIAASRTYLKENYHDGAPLEYLQRAGDNRWMHPRTAHKLHFILTMLRDRGEAETFCFIREVVLKGLPFAEEE